jgi:DNA-binding NarL/FixJ family response regulator
MRAAMVTMTEVIRVVVIDEQPLFRDGLIAALTTAFKRTHIEQGSSGSDGLALYLGFEPHIVLLGLTNQDEAVETVLTLTKKLPSAKVIYLSAPGNERVIQEVLRAGAKGCVSKVVTGPEVVRCIQAVHLGESYVSPSLAARLLGRPGSRQGMGRRDDVLSALTARENKIMKEVALGLTNKEIAIKLLLSDNTVKRYMTQIMQKLHVRNRLEAVLLLRTRGILMSDNGA